MRDVSDFQIHDNTIMIASNHVIVVVNATTAQQVKVESNESDKYLIVHY